MADNLSVTAGAGATVATDQINNLHYQRVKLADGSADSEAMIYGDSTNGLDVDVTRLPDLTGGTVDLISNLASGTLAILTDGTVSKVGTVPGVGIVGNLNGGTLGILTNGSIVVTAGTVTAGTINIGTVKLDGRPAVNIASYGTTFGGTEALYGTLVAAPGTGTSIWVNDLTIVNSAGTITCLVGFGTALNGASVLAKGSFGANSGIQKSYPLAVNAATTNKDLVCYISGAGTADFNVSYFIA